MTRCFIGLGSNLNDPAKQIRAALAALSAHADIALTHSSSLYRNPAIGPGEQPDYLNAVAEVTTALKPLALLHALQAIETHQGRIRTIHWGARTLDLDLLLFGDETLATAELIVPHPHMTARNFVLYPLFEIAPELVLPDGTSLRALLDCCPDIGLQRL
ncbi:MAG: 2-amino-4-hydroxy-6-hydroxymethyldihydropteridine diphosphokinase [Verrucomicrobiaceae bacterium]|nr:2-amino-4-hydroxy-6-hydroxymethyldihydropteridine diphosphokinase [Verrucomicrobiaceae bacterium]